MAVHAVVVGQQRSGSSVSRVIEIVLIGDTMPRTGQYQDGRRCSLCHSCELNCIYLRMSRWLDCVGGCSSRMGSNSTVDNKSFLPDPASCPCSCSSHGGRVCIVYRTNRKDTRSEGISAGKSGACSTAWVCNVDDCMYSSVHD